MLEKAVRYLNHPNDGGVLEVVRFLATNAQNPEIIREKMLTADIFRENYPAVVQAKNWKESRVRNFIESVCRHLEVPIPEEARFVFLRAKIERELKEFKDGETEPADFYDICVQHTKNKEEEFKCCIEYLANHSNTLCRFFCKTRGVPFTHNDEVSTSTPECATPYNRCLHELACGRNKFLNDGNAVAEFMECVKEPQFAVLQHSGKTAGNLISFRFRRYAFHYSRHHSRGERDKLVEILQSIHPSTKVFVFKASYALPLLEKEFDWVPENVKDAHELAKGIPNIHPAIAEFSRYLTDGAHCWRGRNFADFSVPSPVVVQHRDIDVSVLYRFTMRVLRLSQADDDDAERRARKREREREREASRSRPRKR